MQNNIFTIPEEEYFQHIENYDGICIECGEWSCGSVEPDACYYLCELCGENTILGAEQALINGYITFTKCKHENQYLRDTLIFYCSDCQEELGR